MKTTTRFLSVQAAAWRVALTQFSFTTLMLGTVWCFRADALADTVSTAWGAGADVEMREQSNRGFDTVAMNTRTSNRGDRNEIIGLRFDLSGYTLAHLTNVSLDLTSFRSDNFTRVMDLYGVDHGTTGGSGSFTTENWDESVLTAFGDLPGLLVTDSNYLSRSINGGSVTHLGRITVAGPVEGATLMFNDPSLIAFIHSYTGSDRVTFLLAAGNNSAGQFRVASKEATNLATAGLFTGTPGTFAPVLRFDVVTPCTNCPPVIAAQPTDQSAIVTGTAAFEVNAYGTAPLSYQWSFNGHALESATNATLRLTAVSTNQAGTYSVVITNQYGSATSRVALLTVSPATAHLIAFYPFEGDAEDISGNGNDGTLYGATPTLTGFEGQAYDFDGLNDFISIPLNINPWALPRLTMGAWVNTDSANRIRAIISHDDGGYDRNLNIDYRGQGSLYRYSAFTGSGVIAAGPSRAPIGEWVFVAVRYDDPAGLLTLDVGTDRITVAAKPGTGYATTRIGSNPGFNEFFDGKIDNVFVYDEVLSDELIEELRRGGAGAIIPNSPAILAQPENLKINVGDTAQFLIMAESPLAMEYQWLFNRVLIHGETNATLVLPDVQPAQAGTYAATVSNLLGSATSSNAVLQVNQYPIAQANAAPNPAISPNGLDANVVLDGSRSSDPDGDPLTYAWFSGPTLVAQGVIVVVPVPVGTNAIDLVVDDGFAQDTNTVTVAVLTTPEAVQRLIALVHDSDLRHKRPLLASLEAALASIQRGNSISAINQLKAFQNKVRAQVIDPVLAMELIDGAGQVIAALGGDGSTQVAGKIHSLKRHPNGKMQMKIKGEAGKSYIVEASTNLVDWEAVGVATVNEDGSFEFEDAEASKYQSRFYRVVEP